MSASRQRFYREVAVSPHSSEGYAVLLDGKPIRTPAGNPFALPNREIAEAVANEWRAQESKINPAAMMLTKLANTAIDRIAPDRAQAVRQVIAFARSDLLCYRADAPADLVERQQRTWDPLLEWARVTFDVDLLCGMGVRHLEQPASAMTTFEQAISRRSDVELAALHAAATLTGSAVIALALASGRVDAAEAFGAAELDETYQAERWGRDEEAERQGRKKLDELVVIAQLFALLRARN
jgi:chaperone required for assembly of F1-ATPase